MNTSVLAMLGYPEIIGILVIVLIMFGAKKLPELARGLGQGIKEFKKATSDVQDDLHRALDDESYPDTPRRSSQRPRTSNDTPREKQADSKESGSKSE